MRDKNQQFIFNDEELSLIKNTFGDDESDNLLYTVRKVLLQFPLTDVEKGWIKLSITPEVHAVLKKRILPEISEEFPLGQLPSILTTLTEQIKVKDVEEMAPQLEAKQLEMDYLEQQFKALHDPETPQPIELVDMGKIGTKEKHMAFVHMTAYLFLLGYIDPMLIFIKSIAGQKTESIEDQKQRMTRDSSK